MTDRAPLPYDFHPEVPSFTVESDDVSHGEQLGDAQVYDSFGMSGQNISPHLRWPGSLADQGIRRDRLRPRRADRVGLLALGGRRHTGAVTELPAGAGSGDDSGLPAGAFSVRNDFGTKDFGGAAPPAGDPPHRYVFAVHALDTDTLGIDSDVSRCGGRVQPEVPHHRAGRHHPGSATNRLPVSGHGSAAREHDG